MLDTLTRVTFLGLHRKHLVCGFKVVFADPETDAAKAVAKLRAGMELLASVDERRFQIVRRYVAHIVVWPGHYTAYDRWGGIHLSVQQLFDAPKELLASALVHEATHLRIAKRGILYNQAIRSRIENVCVREQAEFLRSVSTEGVRWAREVEAGIKSPWWNDSHRRKRVERILHEAGLPRWIASMLHH